MYGLKGEGSAKRFKGIPRLLVQQVTIEGSSIVKKVLLISISQQYDTLKFQVYRLPNEEENWSNDSLMRLHNRVLPDSTE